MSEYGVFSGPYFPAFGLNTEILRISPYSVRMGENTDQKKLCIWTLFMPRPYSEWEADKNTPPSFLRVTFPDIGIRPLNFLT